MPIVCHEITNHLPKNRTCRRNKKGKDNSNARKCDEKSFLKETWCSWINHPNQQTRKKFEKKGDWKRTMPVNAMIRFFFLKDKTWCLWSNHANQQATDEGSQKVKKKKNLKGNTACGCDDKIFWKTKRDVLDHQLAIADGPTLQVILERNVTSNSRRSAAFSFLERPTSKWSDSQSTTEKATKALEVIFPPPPKKKTKKHVHSPGKWLRTITHACTFSWTVQHLLHPRFFNFPFTSL